MKKEQLAAQLFTLRDEMQTPAKIAEGLKKVKEIGYDAVQVSGIGPIDLKELKNILDGEGLLCCATHESGSDIVENTQKVIDKLNALDCKYTAYPFPHVDLKTREDFIKLAAQLNEAGRKMNEAGQVLTYHNHQLEFVKFGDKTALDIIYENTDSEFVQGEPDLFWIQYGGACPIEWCTKLKNRLPLVHMKDLGIVGQEIMTMEIGRGNLNWKKIVDVCDNSGAKWYIVEQDNCQGNPFDSLKISYDYIRKELL